MAHIRLPELPVSDMLDDMSLQQRSSIRAARHATDECAIDDIMTFTRARGAAPPLMPRDMPP